MKIQGGVGVEVCVLVSVVLIIYSLTPRDIQRWELYQFLLS